MSSSVRDIVHDLTDMDIHIKDCLDHYKLFTNELRPFEVDLLQDALEDEDYASWRFDNNDVQFLKVPQDDH